MLREKIRFYCRFALLIVDEIGYLPVVPGGGNLFFQLVNARYERGAMILTSNRGFAEWGEVFGDPVVATALLDRLLAPRRRRAGGGRKLSTAPARRPRARAHPLQGFDPSAAQHRSFQATREATESRADGDGVDVHCCQPSGEYSKPTIGEIPRTVDTIFHNQIRFWGMTPSYAFVGEPRDGRRHQALFRTLNEQIVHSQNITRLSTRSVTPSAPSSPATTPSG